MSTATRHDLFRFIHKGLRALLSHCLTAVGQTDWQQVDNARRVLREVRTLLELCAAHLHLEERYIHTAMEARRPGASEHSGTDHRQQAWTLTRLLNDIETLETAIGRQRQAAAATLYLHLGLFTSEQLEHMAAEEIDDNAVLWTLYDDTELRRIEQRLLGSVAPARLRRFLQWMLPALAPEERAACLHDLRLMLPATTLATLGDCLPPATSRSVQATSKPDMQHCA